MVGGTGAFGERLVRGLAATTTLRVVVAGRGLRRAEELADQVNAGELPRRVTALRMNVATVEAADLRAIGAFAVIDAAGPFHPGGLRLARAAIAAGTHYLDLADGRAFVSGFAEALDAEARAAGVVALTGASSTPALSCAVLDALTSTWTGVDTVDVSILPGNRAPRGLSVMRSILSWAGQPVAVLLDGRWAQRSGWGMTSRGELPGVGRRWMALAESPDLDIVPARYDVTRTAIFRAGLELSILHLGLLALSVPVRAARAFHTRLTLTPMAPLLRWVAQRFHRFGTDRGGMLVEATGRDADGHLVRCRWSLVAEAGDGPVIPTIPALAAVRALDHGRLNEPGARPCVGVLTLAQISAEFRPYRITTTVEEERQPRDRPLFARALGEAAYSGLPAAVRTVHTPHPWLLLAGRAAVDGPVGLLARLFAALFRFPATAADTSVEVTIEAIGTVEIWTRNFGGRRFRSSLCLEPTHTAHRLEEYFWPFAFRLAVTADASGLSMEMTGWRCGKLPLPRVLAPRIVAREWVDEAGRFRFDVSIAIPVAGPVVRYYGWLEPERRVVSKTRSSTALENPKIGLEAPLRET